MLYKMKLRVILKCFLVITFTSLLFACNTSNKITNETYTYFQNGLDSVKYIQSTLPLIQKNDQLSIQVTSTSLNQEQTLPFNLPPSASTTGYHVNMAGEVELPVIGSVKAAGLTQDQLQKIIVEKLAPYVKDPTVMVHFLQFKVNVLGEVHSPGTKTFASDRVNIIDVISAAGDLTELGKREDVAVIREESTGRKIYKVDLRSGSLFQSPVYIVQSNDIVYVGASDQKFKQLKAATKSFTQEALQVFVTVISLFTSILLAVKLFQ